MYPGRPDPQRTAIPTDPALCSRIVWWTAARLTVGTLFKAAFRVRLAGATNIPERGGALLAYNHVSVLDPIAVSLAAARRGRPVRFLALAELFDQGWVGWSLRRIDQIPLRRGLGDWAAIERVADALRGGSLAGMSPEGTVGEGTSLQPGQRGAARIALAAGVPVLPVGVWGTQRRWPKAGLYWGPPLRPALGVAVGAPIMASGDPRDRTEVLALTERLMGELQHAVDVARALARTGGEGPGPGPGTGEGPGPDTRHRLH
jgi:1-acyl-sn-glycerol-3-phosphate acyltransferase